VVASRNPSSSPVPASAGLTAALALAGKGLSRRHSRKGRAPRGSRRRSAAFAQRQPRIDRAGIAAAACRTRVTPDAISIMSAQRGGEIARLPLGEAAAFRAGAPYWVVHRADLQERCRPTSTTIPDIELRLGCQFEDAVSHAKGLTWSSAAGVTRQQELAVALSAPTESGRRPASSVSGSAAAVFRTDRLARNPRGHGTAA